MIDIEKYGGKYTEEDCFFIGDCAIIVPTDVMRTDVTSNVIRQSFDEGRDFNVIFVEVNYNVALRNNEKTADFFKP